MRVQGIAEENLIIALRDRDKNGEWEVSASGLVAQVMTLAEDMGHSTDCLNLIHINSDDLAGGETRLYSLD